jgi:hypothetical protein
MCALNAYEGPASLHVLNDGKLRSSALTVLDKVADRALTLDRLGNAGSYRYAIDYALDNFNRDDLVYFVEDDYLHTPEALNVLRDGAAGLPASVRYYTLFDHLDPLFDQGPDCRTPAGPTWVYLIAGTVWRTVASTCMTFAAHVSTLEADRQTHLAFARGQVPDDFRMHLSLQGGPWARRLLKVRPWLPGRVNQFVFVKTREAVLRYITRWPVGRLVATCPGHACHVELVGGLAPGRDWRALAASTALGGRGRSGLLINRPPAAGSMSEREAEWGRPPSRATHDTIATPSCSVRQIHDDAGIRSQDAGLDARQEPHQAIEQGDGALHSRG